MLIKEFKQLSKEDVNIAGGKGASLGEMTSAGIPVPPGFVVLAGSFDRFLEETQTSADIEAILKKVDHKDTNSVDGASAEISAIIMNVLMPDDIQAEILKSFEKLDSEFVAVRSSATAEDSSSASWAGELESCLNVTKKELLESVKKCWASLFTPRAIFYRFEKEMYNTSVSVAVVVQKMVQSEISGISFTVHPVTEDHNQMVIEAGFGLGEAIVGGMITPDTYVVSKSEIRNSKSETNKELIIDKYISEQKIMIAKTSKEGAGEVKVPESHREVQKLKDDEITRIAKICLDIEKHYGFPCDIEWAFENNRFYIVQSRPITTLSKT